VLSEGEINGVSWRDSVYILAVLEKIKDSGKQRD